jgi:hypothetical protein
LYEETFPYPSYNSQCFSVVKITGVKKADGFLIKNYRTFNFYDVDASGCPYPTINLI